MIRPIDLTPACLFPSRGEDYNEYYILALLNSKLLWKWFRHNAKWRGGLEINGNVLRGAPIYAVHFSSSSETALYNELCRLAAFMQLATRKLSAARTDRERTVLQPQIEATDCQIDQHVCELYGLTDAEIAMVEGGGQPITLAAQQA